MKFLFATDFHIMGTTPSSRIDNYPQTIKNKIDEIFDIASREQVDFVVLGGDIFETYNASISVIREALQSFKNREVPIFSVLGNHDLYGHTIKTFHRSAVSVMEMAEAINIVDFDKERGLCFLHYYTGIEEDLAKDNKSPSELVQQALDGQAIIWVTHAMISDKELKYISRNIVIDNIKVSTKTKLVLCGDYHPGFPTTIRDDGVVFINPGAVSRRNATQDNLTRDVQIALVQYDPNDFSYDIKVDYVKLKSALPANKVFDLEKIKSGKTEKQKTFSYIEKLQNLEIDDMTDDLEDELRKFASEAELEKDILTEILYRFHSLDV